MNASKNYCYTFILKIYIFPTFLASKQARNM